MGRHEVHVAGCVRVLEEGVRLSVAGGVATEHGVRGVQPGAEHDENEEGAHLGELHAKLDAIDGYTTESRAATLLHGLGFSQDQINNPVNSFSGGWRMRLNLAQALMCRSDLLLLDEPTNHLDLDAVIWLQSWLVSYQGTLVLISHDREFLLLL